MAEELRERAAFPQQREGDRRTGPRTTWGAIPMKRRFKGPSRYAILGLNHFGARVRRSVPGRSVQAESFVPAPGNPQALSGSSAICRNGTGRLLV